MTTEERINNAWRVLVGEPVKPIPTRYWHAFGRVREFPRTDGEPPDTAHQLTVIGPALASPEIGRTMAAESWGEYLTSFDHPPTRREKAELTPEEYRDEEDERALAGRADDVDVDEFDEEW